MVPPLQVSDWLAWIGHILSHIYTLTALHMVPPLQVSNRSLTDAKADLQAKVRGIGGIWAVWGKWVAYNVW